VSEAGWRDGIGGRVDKFLLLGESAELSLVLPCASHCGSPRWSVCGRHGSSRPRPMSTGGIKRAPCTGALCLKERLCRRRERACDLSPVRNCDCIAHKGSVMFVRESGGGGAGYEPETRVWLQASNVWEQSIHLAHTNSALIARPRAATYVQL
jgi:hypothetical protein